jgi:hypothetical protein
VTAIVYECEFDELLNKFKNNEIVSQFLQTNKLLPFVLREVAQPRDRDWPKKKRATAFPASPVDAPPNASQWIVENSGDLLVQNHPMLDDEKTDPPGAAGVANHGRR